MVQLRVRFGGVFRLASILATTALIVAGGELGHTATFSIVCGDASGDGEVSASDALFTLRGAVGSHECPPPRCDCNDNGSVTASDAMGVLQAAVGQQVLLRCPTGASVTTTSTTSTTSVTLSATCDNGEVDTGEDCDVPGAFCRGGCNPFTGICVDFACSDDCACAPPLCGDWMIDPGEDCDPPGSACEVGTCGSNCGCEP